MAIVDRALQGKVELVTGASRRLFRVASSTAMALVLYYFVVDGVVYGILGNHVDAFWLMYLATTFDGLGISVPQILLGVGVLLGLGVLELGLLRLAARPWAPRLMGAGLAAVCALSFAVSQAPE